MAATTFLSLTLPNPTFKTLNIPTYPSSSTFLLHQRTGRKSYVASPNQAQPINVDYLEQEFGGHGVKFQSLEEDSCCVAKIKMSNGSSATFLLPHGLITSYKAKMWHGGTVELIQTSVDDGGRGGDDGGAVIQGGVSLAVELVVSGFGGFGLGLTDWVVADVRGDPTDCIEVELVCTSTSNQMVDARYIMSMEKDMLSSELKLENLNRSSSIRITGSILTHLTVSTPEATTACGLDGSNFVSRPMLRSRFSIVPPEIGDERDIFGNRTYPGVVSKEEEEEGEEIDSQKVLTDEMCRVYTCAARNFTLLDRGRRNSVVVGREGFDELYIYSPGSIHESYGKYSYIAVGQSALVNPVLLGPGQQWSGKQHLHNPNL
ncbi:Protein NDH-DEPENDENT CYCLIC ELECTRON FLOW 5 [Linum grandiflorum]